jgi:ADP-heptose:LPS heptosyltransferase
MEETGGEVIIVGAGSERELGETICRSDGFRENERTRQHGGGSPRTINLTGTGDIAMAAALLQRATVFVGNDSGLAHLAAAVGTPTVVVSGPGDPAEIGPYSPLAVSVRRPVFCSPCHKGVCWRNDKPRECLDLVRVEDVWMRVHEMIPGIAG